MFYNCLFKQTTLFKKTFQPLYLGYADLLLQQVGITPLEEQKQILLKQARDAIELMKKNEMEDYLKERCRPSVPINLKSKDPRAAVIYPISLPDRLEIIVSIADENEKSDKLYQITQPIKADDLKNTAESFSNYLHTREPFTADFKQQSMFLYGMLISRIKTLLEKEKIDTLVYVPDGFLRLIPLAALYDGKNFLIQDYAVVTSIGMSLVENDFRQYENQDMLLAGTSKTKDNFFKSLPSVKIEIEELAKQNEIADYLLDESFSLERFKQEIKGKPHKYLFIASHGFFGETEKENYILTYDAQLNMKDLKKLLDADFFKKHPIDLITLSACHTAKGNEKIPLGLSGMAIKSKVHSALGSLWKVPDNETKELMLNFYKILKEEPENKAKALQQAQITYLKNCDGNKPKKPKSCKYPSNWAAFILVGDWQ